MSLKREVSKSVQNLQSTVKRLALDEELSRKEHSGSLSSHPSPVLSALSSSSSHTSDSEKGSGIEETMNSVGNGISQNKEVSAPISTVLSSSRYDFDECYERLEEVGRGGFSVVYKCRSLHNNEIFAVKVVDLRPLKLHERFNPSRLRREVDIMRKLRHDNIIQFVEVFETEQQLMVVMEYAPGDELFDVILARQFFSEEDAKPIFQQVSSALSYLHQMDIIHRDIKPENILYLHHKNPVTNLPIVKLLDFGLSKHAGMGSEAKTFVGTPCYLAPEVEMTAKGQGASYGAPADCWSLGAVLYVMLVARFPEFHRYENGKIELKLPEALWGDKSDAARDLVKGLMCYDQSKRITARQALAHPWLGQYAVNLPPPPLTPSPGLLGTPPASSVVSAKSDGKASDVMDMILFPHRVVNNSYYMSPNLSISVPSKQSPLFGKYALTTNNVAKMGGQVANLHISPLLALQRKIAHCIEEVHNSSSFHPSISVQAREAAIVCRAQVDESTKMLQKIEQTAISVLDMFPDLELSLDENEPALAGVFFQMVKAWVGELVTAVEKTQKANKASISKIQSILEISTHNMKVSNSPRIANSSGGDKVTISLSDLQRTLIDLQSKKNSSSLSASDFVELFSSLFDHDKSAMSLSRSAPSPRSDATSGYSSEDDIIIGGNSKCSRSQPVFEEVDAMETEARHSHGESRQNEVENNQNAVTLYDGTSAVSSSGLSPKEQLGKALEVMEHVDSILEQLGMFWGSTEVILDTLSKKGQHAEQFISFSHNPKLLQRFKERVNDYRQFWENILSMCSAYMREVAEPQDTLARYSTPPEEVNLTPNSSISTSSSSLNDRQNKRQTATPSSTAYFNNLMPNYTQNYPQKMDSLE